MVKKHRKKSHRTGLLEAVQLTFKRYTCMWCANQGGLVLVISARQFSMEHTNQRGTLA